VEVDITVENEKIEGHAVVVQRLSNLKNEGREGSEF
jgi:hypothetical protein